MGRGMAKRQWWQSDWLAGLAVVVLFSLLWLGTSLLQRLEDRSYDLGMRLTSRPASERIAVIAIDQRSLDNLGRWPWSREIHAQFLDHLAKAQPALILESILFTEAQRDRGQTYLENLLARVRGNPERFPPDLEPELATQLAELDVDQLLADSMARSGRVLLPFLFQLGEEDSAEPAADFLRRTEIEAGGDPALGQPQAVRAPVLPMAKLGAAALGVGSQNLQPDRDGVLRQVALAFRHGDAIYPSYTALAAGRALGQNPSRLILGESLSLSGATLRTAPDATLRPLFQRQRGDAPAFEVDSFFDVASGKISLEKYRGKIVLIGATAPGIGAALTTPVEAALPPVLVEANILSALMQQQYFVQPAWAPALAFGASLLVALYLCLLLPRLGAGIGAALSLGISIMLVGGEFYLLTQQLIWLPLMTSACLLLIGHLALTTKRHLLTEARQEAASAASAESNRMLALTFQSQGQLDLAFDKLRRVPKDEEACEPLYNLALDFERRRQFNKAQAVYDYLLSFAPDFRDVKTKRQRAQAMSETVVLGGGSQNGTRILSDGSVEKPMLGRYQLERELGKGAMGVVYLGRDPKLGREVAIKTMALSEEFEAAQLDEARARFFREAETAGRLSHPQIVTIFDVGEEHDLAYIAMELLKGDSLEVWAQPAKLLPLTEALAAIRQVALALDYAHKQNVVHRDIKPANIMYDRASRKIKVMDFGVARITDSSKTKTGMVLGTPSFMSPEQLAGKKIDGRSDLFSLGGTLYQLVCGHQPFGGDTLGELMFHITNDAPPDPRKFNPQLPSVLYALIMKAMHKDVAQRFQSGAQFALAIAKLEGALQKRQGAAS